MARMNHRRVFLRLATAVAVAGLAAGAFAQPPSWGRRWRMPPRFATADSFDGRFNFCRLMYDSERRESGGMGWWTDYPTADANLTIRLGELTKAGVSTLENGEPNFLVVRATDEALFQCPFIHIEDAGTVAFSDEEVRHLRAYLLKGGFLWSDDFWGTRAWLAWKRELSRVLPPGEFPVVDLPDDHPIFSTLFKVDGLPQIPSIQFWRQSRGLTSERGTDSAQPHARAILDRHRNIMVLMTHNTDISDAWEREGEDPEFFYTFSVNGYAVAINTILYAMTH